MKTGPKFGTYILPGGHLVKRIKRITSHVGLSRYMDTLADTNHIIDRIREIPSPYAYSPEHIVYRTPEGQYVFIVETAHKTYDVFLVPATIGTRVRPEAA